MQITIAPVGIIGTNCYILQSKEDNCAVIDPGAQPDKILDLIKKRKLTPKYVLLTHGHHDHIGAVNAILRQFPDAKLYIGEKDLEQLTDPEKSYASSRNGSAEEYNITKGEGVADGFELTLDELTIRVLDTPGHTKGGVSYLCEDALFAGDTLFYQNCGRCDLYGGNYDILMTSLKELSQLPGEYTVYPGHGPSTSMEFERKNNPYMIQANA